MTTVLDMPVRLYSSPEQMAAGTPEWTGSLDEFWSANNHAYTWGEIRALADELTSTGFHRGAGAAAEFWLVRGGEAAAPAPQSDVKDELHEAFERLLDAVELVCCNPKVYGYPVEDNRHPFHQSVLQARSVLRRG